MISDVPLYITFRLHLTGAAFVRAWTLFVRVEPVGRAHPLSKGFPAFPDA